MKTTETQRNCDAKQQFQVVVAASHATKKDPATLKPWQGLVG